MKTTRVALVSACSRVRVSGSVSATAAADTREEGEWRQEQSVYNQRDALVDRMPEATTDSRVQTYESMMHNQLVVPFVLLMVVDEIESIVEEVSCGNRGARESRTSVKGDLSSTVTQPTVGDTARDVA